MGESSRGQGELNPVFWLATCPSCPPEIFRESPAGRSFLFVCVIISFIHQACSFKVAGNSPRFFLPFYWPQLRLRQYQTILTSRVVNNAYLLCTGSAFPTCLPHGWAHDTLCWAAVDLFVCLFVCFFSPTFTYIFSAQGSSVSSDRFQQQRHKHPGHVAKHIPVYDTWYLTRICRALHKSELSRRPELHRNKTRLEYL